MTNSQQYGAVNAEPIRLDASRDRRRALVALALLVPAPTIGTVMAMGVAPGPVGQSIYFASKLWILLAPLVWHRLVEREPLGVARPSRLGNAAGLATGALIGAGIYSAYVIAGGVIDAEALRSAASQNGIGDPARYIAFAVYLCAVNALLEEYVWRWFVYQQCEAIVAPVPAVALSATLFTIHHVIALRLQVGWTVTILGSAGVWIGGAIWSWLYLRYRSIWPGYVSHVIADIVILAIGYELIFG
ncbi:MAG: CPBP family intramembrane glutamic endopeptidase [Phycisphaerales bacterium]